MTRKLTETERCSIVHALRVAVEVYKRDAEATAQEPSGALTAQFTRQVEEVEALVSLIEDADMVKVQRYNTVRELDPRYEDRRGA